MILVRTPLRITLGGGGTDLPSYSSVRGGYGICATISKYTYVALNKKFTDGLFLRYSENESPTNFYDIKHPIIKEALTVLNLGRENLEIVSIADVPSDGAGLGNSGSFTVCLLEALSNHGHKGMSKDEIAHYACFINMVLLKKHQGKQDEYSCCYGGLNEFIFNQSGDVEWCPLELPKGSIHTLEENLLLFYTGIKHDTEHILSYQSEKTCNKDEDMIKNLDATKELGILCAEKLEAGKLRDFGDLLNEQWRLKEARMPVSEAYLCDLHEGLNNNGAIGSKLVGSGMGGFFLVYAENRERVREYAEKKKLHELRFTFDFEGVKRII